MSDTANTSRPSALRRLGRTVKGFLLWKHERMSWQYDVMCGVIFLFVVLAPARFFHDKPVYNPHATLDVVKMDSDARGVRYRVSAELLASYDNDPGRAALEVLALNLGHPFTLTRIEPIRAQDGTVVWYDVWVRE
ncbi:MAG: hypothetical protein HY656_08035 [Acidobacteria bacterium]|nr:hypothetical protein [Acidobacteriota bacterium]